MDSSQADAKPVVYIFHGDDPLAIRRHVDALVQQMGDPSLADLNISRLDGRQSNDDDLRLAANSMPFLAERRLVIVTNPFARLNNDAARKRFKALLDEVPETTALVLVVDDYIDKKDWKSMPGTHFVRRWAGSAGERALYELCQQPAFKAMPEWIRKEAQRLGGKFTAEAASALATHTGSDTQLASLEIQKLLNYVDYKRPVEGEDVNELTAQTGQADVFDMVDSLANGNTRQALTLLHRLLEDQEPISLFGMIVRQFRLLLQARELLDEGRGGQIAGELRLHSFVAEKLSGQARRFTLPQLEEIYHRLLLMDEMVKTGQSTYELAFDTFIAGLAR